MWVYFTIKKTDIYLMVCSVSASSQSETSPYLSCGISACNSVFLFLSGDPSEL